jgi:uncharacterized delta-60 repeat protein
MARTRAALVTVAVAVAIVGSSVPASATGGDLDTTFGTDGTKQLTDQYGHLTLGPTALDDAGRTLVALNSAKGAFLVRLTGAGHFDRSYGNSGVTPLPGRIDVMRRMASRPGGGFLIMVAQFSAGDSASTKLVALTTAGAIDTAYGTNGVATAPFTGANEQPLDLAVTNDGSAVVAMNGFQPNGWRLIRFTPTGQRDTTFGGGGIATAPWPGFAALWGVTALASGGFLAIGDDSPSGIGSNAAVAAFHPDGSLVQSFGVNGRAVYPLPGGNAYGRRALQLASGDLVFAIDSVDDQGKVQVVLQRTHARGRPDSSFGVNGRANVGAPNGEGGVGSVLLDGTTVVLDRGVAFGPLVGAIDRVDAASGAADTTFGDNGELTVAGLVSVFAVDTQGRLYDSGVLEHSFGPIGVVQRRLDS